MAMAMMRAFEIGSGVHSGSTIHSGHYMMSCLDETSDDTDYYGYTTAADVDQQQHQQQQPSLKQELDVDSSFRSSDARISCFIENNLAELLRYMTLTYNGTLPSPKWKDFKGIKLKLRQKIRLNNIIWREWHMQYIKFRIPVVCQFDVPTSDRTHNKPEAVVLEGKYCKRRLESLAVEYSRWRFYAKQKRQLIKNEEKLKKKMLIDSGHLDGFMSLLQSFADESSRVDSELDTKKLDFSTDQLFTSLMQPFAFPCARELAAEARNYFSSEMIVQPGLIQLQPSLPENLRSYEMKPCRPFESKKINRRNPILSSLLTGTTSCLNGLGTNKCQSSASTDIRSLPLLNNNSNTQEQAMESKSGNFFMPLFELCTSSGQFSSQLPSISSSMTFVQQDVQPDISTAGFSSSGYSSVSFPLTSVSAVAANQSNHLRMLLQSNSEYKLQKEESVVRSTTPSSPSALLPNKRRRSTGQTVHVQGVASTQACNKNLQKLIDSEVQDRTYRRASTGTLVPSNDALMSLNSEVFAVPQKVQKLKSHSVGSQPAMESLPAPVRRRKTSCVSRGACQMSYQETCMVGNSSSSSNNGSGPLVGQQCSSIVSDTSSVWNAPLMSWLQPAESDCPFEAEEFRCEMDDPVSSPMTAGHRLTSAVVCVGRTAEAVSATPVTTLTGCLVRPRLEQERQQMLMQHVEQRRALHLSSEQKRRVSINSGFERLDEIIRSSGEKTSSKSSKSATLHKSAQFIRNLHKEKLQLHNEAERLKKEIKILQDDLNLLQSNLPVSGCLPAIHPNTEVMCELFDEYVRTRTQSNWKFWIFGQLMRPIYETYVQSLSTVFLSNLGQAAKFWLEKHCSLAILRPAFSNELREICKSTSLINNPSKLPQEVLQAANCIKKAE